MILVVDQDGDGQPGVTVQIDGILEAMFSWYSG